MEGPVTSPIKHRDLHQRQVRLEVASFVRIFFIPHQVELSAHVESSWLLARSPPLTHLLLLQSPAIGRSARCSFP
jgi:hypothetical protein